MTRISKEALEAMRVVQNWWERDGETLEEVAEALSQLPSVSTYGGKTHMVVSEIQRGGAPGFQVELTEEKDRDGYPRVRIVRK